MSVADFYNENGYFLAQDVFTPAEIAEMQRETTDLLARANASGRKMEATWQGDWREKAGIGTLTETKTKVDSIHNVQNHSAYFTRLLLHERLLDYAAEILGPNIQLHHTKLHSKPPAHGSPFPLHQDYPYFPHTNNEILAALIHIDDATVENGCLCVVPGSHKLGPLPCRSGDDKYLSLDDWPVERAVAIPAKAGDVAFFSYLTVHGSYLNTSRRERRIVLVQLRSATNRPLDSQHVSPGQGMMLRGFNPDALQK